MYSLTRFEWQFFGTFTFREAFLRQHESGIADARRSSIFLKWGRTAFENLKYSKSSFHKSYNCRRLEAGEIGGLWHLHWLMAGLELRQVNIATANFLKAVWLRVRGGHCQVELFDRSQNGIEYISKCLDPKKRFEFNRFGLARTMTLSPALLSVLSHQQSIGFDHACRRGARVQRFAAAKNSVLSNVEGLDQPRL